MDTPNKIRLRDAVTRCIKFAKGMPKLKCDNLTIHPSVVTMSFEATHTTYKSMVVKFLCDKVCVSIYDKAEGDKPTQTIELSYNDRTTFDIATKMLGYIEQFDQTYTVVFNSDHDLDDC